jgi:hypothetical protein
VAFQSHSFAWPNNFLFFYFLFCCFFFACLLQGDYLTDPLPLNPRGRTGLQGRGVLGRFGPNHAVDPVVTRSPKMKKKERKKERKKGRKTNWKG